MTSVKKKMRSKKTKITQNQKILLFVSVITAQITIVSAHMDSQDYHNGMMWGDGGMMHNMGHMAGYNMWGPGWAGVIVGLIVWTLAVIGVYHLYREYVQKREEE